MLNLFEGYNLNAKPFLKWAGGKTQLIPQIKNSLPKDIICKDFTFIEPFVGSGAILFWMLRTFPNLKKAVINDVNSDLINVYEIIKNKPKSLIENLASLQKEFHAYEGEENSKKEFYYDKRIVYNSRSQEKPLQAALFIFLNRTCFNGLYRVNKNNGFNVPMGSYKKPTILDEPNIWEVSKALKRVEILCGDYQETLSHAADKSLFYFDPPYKPLSDTSSFNSYAKDVFGDEEQIRLRDFCKTLNILGHSWILSNSDVNGKDMTDTFFDDIYDEFFNGVTLSGRALRYNLLFLKEKNKRIYTSIPNAKLSA